VTDVRSWLATALAADPNDDPGAQATPLPVFAPFVPTRVSSADDQKRLLAQRSSQYTTLVRWWVERMTAVTTPVHEKLTLIWHNHFATSAAMVWSPAAMAAQNQKLRTLGTGDFRTLAYAMLTDWAMLDWLNGLQNVAKAPNENLSREFMELFALGHGDGYTEADVREGARALTGWAITLDGSTRLEPELHDGGVKTVLGVTGPLDAAGFCDAVLAQPAAAGYVAARTWRQLAADANPSPKVLDRIVAAYGPGRDLCALVEAILTDDEFISASGTIVVGPVEWLLGAVRALRVPTSAAIIGKLTDALRNLGQLPFYPPNVGGWPSGRAWLSTAAASLRLDTAEWLTAHADLSAIDSVGRFDRIDAVGYLLGVGTWSDRSAGVLRDYVGNPKRLTAVALNTPEYLTV
jgi:uncharacterized protein (DUF1800 family)